MCCTPNTIRNVTFSSTFDLTSHVLFRSNWAQSVMRVNVCIPIYWCVCRVLSCVFVAMHVCVSVHASVQMPLHANVCVSGEETEGARTAQKRVRK